jgi:hypothetical protein
MYVKGDFIAIRTIAHIRAVASLYVPTLAATRSRLRRLQRGILYHTYMLDSEYTTVIGGIHSSKHIFTRLRTNLAQWTHGAAQCTMVGLLHTGGEILCMFFSERVHISNTLRLLLF